MQLAITSTLATVLTDIQPADGCPLMQLCNVVFGSVLPPRYLLLWPCQTDHDSQGAEQTSCRALHALWHYVKTQRHAAASRVC